MTDEKLICFAKADLADYEAQFSGIAALPFGKTLLQRLLGHYCKDVANLPPATGYGCDKTLLILTESYPNEHNPYRNGFVHRRVKAYEAYGVKAEVFCMDFAAEPETYTFDGVKVTVGQRAQLYAYLMQNPQMNDIFVHFLNRAMWDVLKEFSQKSFTVFSHGYDILPAYHRPFLYPTRAEKAFGEAQSKQRMAFWNELFALAKAGEYDLTFVFVSEYLRKLVFTDHPALGEIWEKTHVIPNCIDTKLFCYTEKTADQRLKMLSVRPYASQNYANDLTAKAIELLSKEDFFEELVFLIAGDGKLFDPITKPLKKYKNVTLHKGFYKQDQLAKLYREYGAALLPTRFDTQGVSRDEAMAAGMAVITTNIAAVPEFADESCALLTPPEDAAAIAAAVKRLYEQKQTFLSISKAARGRAETLSPDVTAKKELLLSKLL